MITLNSLRRRSENSCTAQLGAEAADRAETTEPGSGPPLMLLVNDAARRSGFRLHKFPNVETAASFIEFWFPPAHRYGLIAFWALHTQPDPAASPGDFALLVRNPSLPGIVHPLSFPDARSGLSFLAAEIADGLDPRQVTAYWTVPVAVSAGPSGEAKLNPARPPVCRSAPVAARGSLAPPAAVTGAPAPACVLPKVAPTRRRVDLLTEVRRVLQTRRWLVRRGAFQGFGSPPGRF